MLSKVMKWLRHLIGSSLRDPKPATIALPDRSGSAARDNMAIFTDEHVETIIPYDQSLLERAKTQWLFGDWQSLAAIDHNGLEHHTDRAKLALLAAAGHAQQGNTADAQHLFQLAEEWGCSKRLIGQILIAGVHNSLGRAAAHMGQEARSLDHFKNSVTIGAPGSDTRLLTGARVSQQLAQLNCAEQMSELYLERAAPDINVDFLFNESSEKFKFGGAGVCSPHGRQLSFSKGRCRQMPNWEQVRK